MRELKKPLAWCLLTFLSLAPCAKLFPGRSSKTSSCWTWRTLRRNKSLALLAALCRFLGPRHGAAIALGQGAWTRAIAHGWGPEKHTRTFFGPMSMSLKTWIYDLFHVVPSLPSLRLMLSYFHVSLFIFAPQHMIASSNLCCKRARPLFM